MTYLAQNLCTLSAGHWNRSVSLVLWKLQGNLLLLAKIFLFFLYNEIVRQCLMNFTAVLQGLVALQLWGSQSSGFQIVS